MPTWFILGLVLGAAIVAAVLLLRRRQEESLARRVVAEAGASRAEELGQIVERLKEAFDALSREAISKNTEDFLGLAADRFKQQTIQAEQLLDKKKALIDEHLAQIAKTLGDLTGQLKEADKSRVASHSELKSRLEQANKATSQLQQTTSELREALSSSQRRGQWGERMAEDVLQLAGFIEGVNYTKQTSLEGGGRPDFTFLLPQDRRLHMDVKFPLDNYMRYLDAPDDATGAAARDAFIADVRRHIKSVTTRDYIDPGNGTVDYVVVFIPNEQLYGFLHEHDPALIDDSIRQKVVLCAPLTLYAVLAVIRQAVESQRLQEASDEILSLLGAFKKQWSKFVECFDALGSRLDAAVREYQSLSTTRTRQLDRQLDKIEDLRGARGLPAEPLLADPPSDDS